MTKLKIAYHYLSHSIEKSEETSIVINGFTFPESTVALMNEIDMRYGLNSNFDLTISSFLNLIVESNTLKQCELNFNQEYNQDYAYALKENIRYLLSQVYLKMKELSL